MEIKYVQKHKLEQTKAAISGSQCVSTSFMCYPVDI